jgi:hypothetical protein
MFKKKTFLGILLGEHSFFVSELSFKGKTYFVNRSFEWVLPDNISDTEQLGVQLQSFLRSKRFSLSSPVIFGVPAKWVLLKDKRVPPADKETLLNLLRIESEKDFSIPLDELVFDYTTFGVKETDGQNLLLLAINKSKMNWISKISKKAKLKPKAIIPYSFALLTTKGVPSNSLVIYFGKESSELVFFVNGMPASLKHLGAFTEISEDAQEERVSSSKLDFISREIKRFFTIPPDYQDVTIPTELIVLDDYGLTEDELKIIEKNVSVPCKVLGKEDAFRASIGLASNGRDIRTLPINFLHSKLLIRKKIGWKDNLLKVAVAIGVVLILIGIGILDVKNKTNEVEILKKQLSKISPELDTAKETLDFISSMQDWRGEKMAFIECLREMTLSFPAEERIWVTSIAIREDMRNLISGKAVDSKNVMEFIKNLQKNDRFSDVKLLYIRQSGGGARDNIFAISFVFNKTGEIDNVARREVK